MRTKSTYEQYCELLEVSPGAPIAEIERSFRDLIKVWHPDRFIDNQQLQIRATRKTSDLTKAFQWLRKHDAYLKQPTETKSTPERILRSLRGSLNEYMERHPSTSPEMVERAVRGLLIEVTPRREEERIYPFAFLEKMRLGEIWTAIVKRRKAVLAWGVLVLLFLFMGSR